jgi:hypothetical protein
MMKMLALNPIAPALTFLTVFVAAFTPKRSFPTAITSLFALVFALIAFGTDVQLSRTLRAGIISASAGNTAQFGAALWLMMVAVVGLIIGTLVVALRGDQQKVTVSIDRGCCC